MQRPRQRRQLDRFAGLVLRAVRLQPVLLVAGPALEEFQLPLDRLRGAVAHREAVFRIADSRRGDFLETHRAPLLEHGQRGVQRAGDDGGIESGAVERLVARHIPIDVDRLRRPALADDRRDLVFFLRINENERFAAEAVEILLEHAAGDQRRDAGVKRVAAFQQDAEGGRGRQRMTGGDATGRSHHRGTQRRSRRLPILDRHLPGERNRENAATQPESSFSRILLHGYLPSRRRTTSRSWPS